MAQEEALRLPSGLEARLQETLTDRRMGTGLDLPVPLCREGLRRGEAAFDR